MTKIITIIITQTLNLSPVTLCCHMHDDGSQGCWPEDASSAVECEQWIDCPGGAHQASADDEESWVCNAPNGRPNS